MIAKFFIMAGIVFIVIGLILLLLGPKKAISWRLPGDIICRRGNFTIYFPITTCIFLSIILTLILRFIFKDR